jgi:hypothetical protein
MPESATFTNDGDEKKQTARCWWLTTVILGTQEADIRRIMV